MKLISVQPLNNSILSRVRFDNYQYRLFPNGFFFFYTIANRVVSIFVVNSIAAHSEFLFKSKYPTLGFRKILLFSVELIKSFRDTAQKIQKTLHLSFSSLPWNSSVFCHKKKIILIVTKKPFSYDFSYYSATSSTRVNLRRHRRTSGGTSTSPSSTSTPRFKIQNIVWKKERLLYTVILKEAINQ